MLQDELNNDKKDDSDLDEIEIGDHVLMMKRHK